MNKLQATMVATVISMLTFSSFAAQQIQQADHTQEKIAVISALGAETPEDLVQKLSDRADAVGASKFKIIMTASNDNSERGTAIAYK